MSRSTRKRSKAVGLDIGRHSVKAVWAERSGGELVVTRTEFLRLPQDGGDSRAVIEPWINQAGLSGTPCVIGISGDQCMFQPLLLPPSDPREMGQAAAMEVIQFNEMASETMAYGYAPISLNPVEKRLVLTMVRPSVLEQALNLADGMGVEVLDIVPLPVAIFNAVESVVEPHDDPAMVVHIGRGTTEIAIGGTGGFMFGRAFSSGGQMFTDTVAKSRGVTASQAEALKLEDQAAVDADEELRPVADLWLSEVQSCLGVYRSLFPERSTAVQAITLTGAAAAMPGLAEYMQQRMALPTRRLDRLPGLDEGEPAGTYAAAAGLAISVMDDAPVSLSLLPKHLHDEQRFRHQKPYWIAAAVTGTLVLAASLVGGFRDQKRKEMQRRIESANLQRMNDLKRDIEMVKGRIEYMRTLSVPVHELLRAAPTMRDLITLLANRMDTEDWLDMICDAESYFSPARFSQIASSPQPEKRGRSRKPRTARQESADDRFSHLIIQGYTRTADLTTVKSLILKLEESGFVESADLLSDDKIVAAYVSTNRLRDPSAKLFVIDLKLSREES